MNLKLALYQVGVSDALESFGVRTAYDRHLGQRMPDGPTHIGAERLARALSADSGHEMPRDSRNYPRLERPVYWGPKASLETATNVSRPSAGIGNYSGV